MIKNSNKPLCDPNIHPFISVSLKNPRKKPSKANFSEIQSPLSRSFANRCCHHQMPFNKSERSSRQKTNKSRRENEHNKLITQETQPHRADTLSKNKIESLLGLGTNRNFQSTKHRKVAALKSLTESSQKYNCQNSFEHKKLMSQNLQLLRINEHLLYEKEYFRQKATLQEVINRQLESKLVQSELELSNMQKLREAQEQQPKEISKKKAKRQKNITRYTEEESSQSEAQAQQSIKGSSKSSLLYESPSFQKTPFQERNPNLVLFKKGKTEDIENNFMIKTEEEFSQLLESVQNQNNPGRKVTLRKMLANKAMELKRLKEKR